MSKITNRDTTPQDGGPVEHRLARLLDGPFLVRVVPHLPPETLHQLIRYRGLDACGELVTSATPAQLNSLLDLDLWRHGRPGHDHRFDADRFGVEPMVVPGPPVTPEIEVEQGGELRGRRRRDELAARIESAVP